MTARHHFIAAAFARSGDDNFVRVLEKHGLLDFYALGTRRGTQGVPPERTRLQPLFGLFNFAVGKLFSTYTGESLRYRSYSLFDRWVERQVPPGRHIFTAYAFAPRAMRRARQLGGRAILSAWTSHPQEFWDVLSEEQRIWNSKWPPISRHYQDLAIQSVEAADYICVASNFSRNSFLKRGYPAERLLYCPYTVDLGVFKPPLEPRPQSRPFTILHTGGLSLRKGAPYLFEAFRLIKQQVPNAVLRVKSHMRDDVKDIVARYASLPIEWTGALDIPDHVRRYQTADLLMFPSVEDGFAFVVAEALACGLPVITTPNTGASDLVKPGVNGEVVPIREPAALADAALKWWERLRNGEKVGGGNEINERLSFRNFETNILSQLARIGIAPHPPVPGSETNGGHDQKP